MHPNHWIFKLPFLKNYDAITLPWGIYFKNTPDLPTIKHELIHIKQKQKLGTTRFYIQYLCEYMRNLITYKNHNEAYMNISFEIEAYKEESN